MDKKHKAVTTSEEVTRIWNELEQQADQQLNWSQPHADRNTYWESDKYDFWITSKRVWHVPSDQSLERWILFNGTEELGHYDTLEEAKDAAEPAHGVWEAKEDAPCCYWCQGTHPGQICKSAPYYVKQ